ncbi:MAG TPA: hypothetical protein VFV39_00380 [Limnobacter sp.]|nr:hypothetical protein [Limnobacter sp.]
MKTRTLIATSALALFAALPAAAMAHSPNQQSDSTTHVQTEITTSKKTRAEVTSELRNVSPEERAQINAS